MRWIAGLTGVALALRAIGLDGGLWIDEITSLIHSFRPALAQIVTEFPHDNRHPLYSVLAHACIAAFGEHPWALRLPALLFGVASVPLLYALGSQVGNRWEAFLAAALLAVSYHHVWFSQNARGYTALAFFTLLSTWLLLRNLAQRSRGRGVGYALAIALGAYTHLTMVFVLLGHAAVVLARNLPWGSRSAASRDGPGPWVGFALAAALTLVLYAPVLMQVRHYFVERASPLKGVSTPAWAAAEALMGLMQGLGAGSGVLAGIVVAAAALAFVVGLASYARRTPLALALFVAPGIAIIGGALVARGTLYPRFLFALIGFALLVGVRGAFAVAGRLAARSVPGAEARALRLGTALVALLILGSAASLPRNYAYPKQDFTGARDWLLAARGNDDVIATVGAARFPYIDWLALPWTAVTDAGELAALRAGGARVWLVYTFARYIEHGAPDLWQVIQTQCRATRTFPGTVSGGDIAVCTLPPTGAIEPTTEPR